MKKTGSEYNVFVCKGRKFSLSHQNIKTIKLFTEQLLTIQMLTLKPMQ